MPPTKKKHHPGEEEPEAHEASEDGSSHLEG